MSKQDIKTVREFNQWRAGQGEFCVDQDTCAVKRALDSVLQWPSDTKPAHTKTAPVCRVMEAQYGGENFDAMVDELVKERK